MKEITSTKKPCLDRNAATTVPAGPAPATIALLPLYCCFPRSASDLKTSVNWKKEAPFVYWFLTSLQTALLSAAAFDIVLLLNPLQVTRELEWIILVLGPGPRALVSSFTEKRAVVWTAGVCTKVWGRSRSSMPLSDPSFKRFG